MFSYTKTDAINGTIGARSPSVCRPQLATLKNDSRCFNNKPLILLYRFDMEIQKNKNTTNHTAARDTGSHNTGGRPRIAKGRARTKTLSTKLSVAEWKIVMKRIADAGKRPLVYLREVLLSGRVVAARTLEDRQQIRMLEGVCNNLNQLAWLAHQQGVQSVLERLLALLDEFNRLLSRI